MNTYPQQFLNAGIGIIPVQYRDKRPDHKALPIGPDGSPSWEIYKTQLPSIEEYNRWFTHDRNYGVVAGWRGLMVLDFDDFDEYIKWRLWASHMGFQSIARLAAEHTFKVQSSRGVHVYLRCETPGTNRKAGKIDIKYHGYVLGPGSTHPSGALYRAIRNDFVMVKITHLSDVLPSEILIQSPILSNIKPPAATAMVIDPWQSAMNSNQAPLGNDIVEKIKKTYRVEDFFTNLSPTSHDGRWFITLCPFHADAHPSFWVDTQLGLCGCFAGCTPKPLDVINLNAALFGISNTESIRLLSNGLGK